MDPAEYARMDEAEQRMWWYRALHARLLDALAGIDGPILDAGCGTGGLLARLAPHPLLYGVDLAPQAAARAAAKSAAAVACGSVAALPFPDGCFAAAASADVLCHAAVDPAAALGELHRVLRPGGRLVLNLPAYQWLLSAHDRRVHNTRRVTAATLERWLVNAGFVAIRVRYWNTLLLPAMVVRRKFRAKGAFSSDVAVFLPLMEAFFHAVCALERRIGLPWPVGGSVLAIAERPG